MFRGLDALAEGLQVGRGGSTDTVRSICAYIRLTKVLLAPSAVVNSDCILPQPPAKKKEEKTQKKNKGCPPRVPWKNASGPLFLALSLLPLAGHPPGVARGAQGECYAQDHCLRCCRRTVTGFFAEPAMDPNRKLDSSRLARPVAGVHKVW